MAGRAGWTGGEPRDVVDLILTVCLLAHPGSCAEKHNLFESSGSLSACMMQAQPWMATWMQEHPNLRVIRYRCAWPDSEKTTL